MEFSYAKKKFREDIGKGRAKIFFLAVTSINF